MDRVATCSCGALQLRTSGEPLRVSVCHCHACQRRTGSAFGAQARFHREQVVASGPATAFVRVGDSGGAATFHFCPTCGATVYYLLSGMPDMVAVPVGAFADAAFPGPTVAVYEARRHPWVAVSGLTETWE